MENIDCFILIIYTGTIRHYNNILSFISKRKKHKEDGNADDIAHDCVT